MKTQKGSQLYLLKTHEEKAREVLRSWEPWDESLFLPRDQGLPGGGSTKADMGASASESDLCFPGPQ